MRRGYLLLLPKLIWNRFLKQNGKWKEREGQRKAVMLDSFESESHYIWITAQCTLSHSSFIGKFSTYRTFFICLVLFASGIVGPQDWIFATPFAFFLIEKKSKEEKTILNGKLNESKWILQPKNRIARFYRRRRRRRRCYFCARHNELNCVCHPKNSCMDRDGFGCAGIQVHCTMYA